VGSVTSCPFRRTSDTQAGEGGRSP
jgi:hypothetical protein